LAAVSVTPLGYAAAAFTCAECPPCRDDEDHGDYEIADLYHFVERGHLALENVDEPSDDQARYEWCEKRPDAASMK
jgi:hypothetical protein